MRYFERIDEQIIPKVAAACPGRQVRNKEEKGRERWEEKEGRGGRKRKGGVGGKEVKFFKNEEKRRKKETIPGA